MALVNTNACIGLPHDIMMHIAKVCDDVKTYGVLKCTTPLFRNIEFMSMSYIEFLKSSYFQSLNDNDRCNYFVIFSKDASDDDIRFVIDETPAL